MKDGRNSLYLLSISIKGLLKQRTCFGVRLLMDKQCLAWLWGPSELMIDLIIWFDGSEKPLRRNLLYNFFKWRWIGNKPEIALMPAIGNMWKAPVIHIAVLHCIFLKILSG